MANLLTGIRLALALPVAWAVADADLLPASGLLVLLVMAVATDCLDGIVARARGTASAQGMLFDHGTDFLFVVSGLAGAAWAGLLHWMLPLAIALAFSQYVLDSYLLSRHRQLRMSFLGRCNGILYFVPLFGISLARLAPTDSLANALFVLTEWLGFGLIGSTALSVMDRSIAPLRNVPTER